MRTFRQLKFTDRLKLDSMLKAGYPKTEIARALHVDRSTIYNELKRGQYQHLNKDWTQEMRYSPDIAQERCEANLKIRGTALKIGNDIEYANYLEDKIVDEGYSPEAVLGQLKVMGSPFKTTICKKTLYNYIDKGIFLRLTNKDLPVKGKRKRKYHKIRRQARASAGKSIELRDKSILSREEFGHWEMDSVIGARGRSKNALLVLTERKTRQEIIFKVSNHSAEEVVRHLDFLEAKWGGLFKQVFKTITVDNGNEFSMASELEKGGRTKVYYCHAYCSSERGSNENNNRMIRRKIPKGLNFDSYTDEDIQAVEEWINNYPRGIFNYHSAKELFTAEIDSLIRSTA